MDTSKIINVIRPLPVRGAGCCIELRANPLDEAQAHEHASLFDALADPTRLRILALLSAQPMPLCVCEIVGAFPLGQPTISHHLKLLRNAGLLLSEKHGLWTYYAVSPARLDQAAAMLKALRPGANEQMPKGGERHDEAGFEADPSRPA